MHHPNGDRLSIPSHEDIKALEKMLGRPSRAALEIVSRCRVGSPLAIKSSPFLPDGSPFPTTFWLTCPVLVKRISRLEGDGLIDRLEARLAADDRLREEFEQAQKDYQRERAELSSVEHASLATGIGGVHDLARIKCLHAHVAHFLAGGENPVGRLVVETVGIPDCRERCA